MQEVAGKQGRTVLFVSHDMAAVKKLCTRAILLQHGTIIYEGLPNDVVDYYLQNAASITSENNFDIQNAKGNKQFVIANIELRNNEGNITQIAESGKDLEIRLQYKVVEKGPDPIVILKIKNNQEQVLFTCLSRNSFNGIMQLQNEGFIGCFIPNLPLLEGTYSVDIILKYGKMLRSILKVPFSLKLKKAIFLEQEKLMPTCKMASLFTINGM
jgi:lipopolysaccharide transport system ATP-binding protein